MIRFYSVLILGVTVLSLLVFQTLLGMRVVHFKGALHAKVHRRLAYAIVAGGVAHGALTLGPLLLLMF